MAFFELGGEDARLQHAAAMRGAPSAPSTSTGRHALQRSAEPNVTASASGPCYASTAGACASSESTPRACALCSLTPASDEHGDREQCLERSDASTSRDGDSSVGEREVMRREAHRGGDRKEETPRSRGDRGALDRLNAKPAPRSAAPSASPVQPRDARERDRAARERNRNAAPRVQDEKGKLDGAARSSAGLRQADAGRGEDALNVAVESHNGWRRQLYRPHQPSPLAAGSC